jgi:hypothetical protein
MFHGKRRVQQARYGLLASAGFVVSACVGSIDTPRTWDNDPTAETVGGVPYATGASTGNPGIPGTNGANPTNGATPNNTNGQVGGNPLTGNGNALNGNPATCSVGGAPMRRLTHAEYNNSVRDLLGDTTRPADTFALDTQIGLFDNSADAQTVPSLLADQYLEAAVDLANGVTDVKALLGCDAAASGAAGTTCVRNFITTFGRRVFRRPVSTEEATSLLAVFTDARTAAADAPNAVRAVIASLLMSPNFLFRPEFGGATSPFAGAKRVTQYEQAARLASLLWASTPDEQLLAAAEADQLTSAAQIETQARRMLADPKAQSAVAAFFDQWLGLGMLDSATKDPAFFPNYNDALRDSMAEERRRFVTHVVWEDDARLETLLTANYSFLNGPLAKLYGATGAPGDEATYKQVALDPAQRAGVMTQGAMLAAFARPDESSPVKRGKWVRTRMLCQDLPDPPANVPQLPALAAGVSNRERFAMHTNNPACSGCHQLIDGLGFGLEHYDSLGAYRTMNQGVPVDASGEVSHTTDIDQAYSGGPELANLLASSEEVRNCVPTQAVRYAWGRRETSEDACSVAAVQKAFAASNGDLRELMVALTQTDTFINYRLAD